MVKILLVEDEKAVRLLTKAKLKGKYDIIEAVDGLDALEKLDETKVDLMIVDIMMPRMDGFEFVKEVRESEDNTPVIMLTAMDSFAHKKRGYDLCIDEYLTKPINYEELTWHIEAILRRSQINSENQIVIGDFVIDENGMKASWKGKDLGFTQTEFKLVYKLLSYPQVIFTKQQIMDDIWGYETDADYNSIKTYINRIRHKLEGCDVFEIVSVRGVGYKAVIFE
nr:response regulator transcription factor [Lachnospiraceae bacterium]